MSPDVDTARRFRAYGRMVDGHVPTPSEALFYARECTAHPDCHGPTRWGWGLAAVMRWERAVAWAQEPLPLP